MEEGGVEWGAESGPDGWMDGLDSTVPFPPIRESQEDEGNKWEMVK